MEEVPESLRSELNDTESGSLAGSCSTQSRLEDRRKKTFSQKKPWFSAINPNYKSRSQTFKKIFPMVPTNERLIVGKQYIYPIPIFWNKRFWIM